MARQARLAGSGALHHVMVRGIDKMSIFKETGDKERFLQRLGENINRGRYRSSRLAPFRQLLQPTIDIMDNKSQVRLWRQQKRAVFFRLYLMPYHN